MSNEEQHINQIIENTFKVLKEVYENQKEPTNNDEKTQHLSHVGSRIVFPKYSELYRGGKTRLSEQELRFIFIEQFNKYLDEYNKNEMNESEKLNWFYSVETPTEEKYLFSENGKKLERPKKVEVSNNNGESASFDLVIHNDKLERIALIEFKAGNPDISCFTKDFLKLREEGKGIPTYFIMYVQSYQRSKDPDYDTIISLNKKIELPKDEKGPYKKDTELRCFVIDPYKKYPETRIESLIKNPNS